MKVLLLQDVYKLGRAGDVKKVASGYGRNYLIPQGFAVLATPGAMAQAERIRSTANTQRAILNQEMSGVAEQLKGLVLAFPARASETGRLYGSINTRMISDAINAKAGTEINHHQINSQPLRMIGEHVVGVRLTVDLIPEISVIVHREGETVQQALDEAAEREQFEYEDEYEEEFDEAEGEEETEDETAAE
ncbi:MAG TPA: 50S ribosomal protein L9 [Chloroflexi bacterium]|nr:50S ribosomal protein L9 [Chloroflexota bacterium]HBY08869.1 50S ribosomal protein L9 [Chloroflexota bacterium]